jgi:hypothetical protein
MALKFGLMILNLNSSLPKKDRRTAPELKIKNFGDVEADHAIQRLSPSSLSD